MEEKVTKDVKEETKEEELDTINLLDLFKSGRAAVIVGVVLFIITAVFVFMYLKPFSRDPKDINGMNVLEDNRGNWVEDVLK